MLRPFFSFYGGKWRDAATYPSPSSNTIIEPFAGSAGYSLRYPERRVVLVELDPVIASVWGFLLRVSPAEIEAIPDIPADGTVDDLRVCEEARWLVGLWLNRASSRPRRSPSSWMRAGVRPGSFWGERVRSTIARQLDAIRHWRVIHGDYHLASDLGEATWFIDPPYQAAGRHYVYGSGRIDFSKLGVWCRSRQGQVIVCEQEGANWLPFGRARSVKTTRRDRRSLEVFYVNSGVGLACNE